MNKEKNKKIIIDIILLPQSKYLFELAKWFSNMEK